MVGEEQNQTQHWAVITECLHNNPKEFIDHFLNFWCGAVEFLRQALRILTLQLTFGSERRANK
jgi:hypothetical protein